MKSAKTRPKGFEVFVDGTCLVLLGVKRCTHVPSTLLGGVKLSVDTTTINDPDVSNKIMYFG